MTNITVDLPGLSLKNPVMPASGCFGFGREYESFVDINQLGAVMMKAATGEKRFGNKTPRVAETSSGMLNAIGLQNPGVDAIIENEIPFLATFDTCIIANIAGSTFEEYKYVASRLSTSPHVHAIELNISCPNVKEGGVQFGTDPSMAAAVTKIVKTASTVPVYVKLSPNVTNVVEIARAVEEAGADGLSMINTLTGMQMNVSERRPIIANKTGGLSGAAIKPIAIRMIYEVYEHVSIPIIGMGGIRTVEDVLEFLLAGAHAVAIGTEHFQNPHVCTQIIEQLPAALQRYGFTSVQDAVGKGHV